MYYLVVDIGSSNGKMYLAYMSDTRTLKMEEVDRFSIERVFLKGHITTNVVSIYARICETIQKLVRRGIQITSLGIDSWCGDYGLIDQDSGVVSVPTFYRDAYTDGYSNKVSRILDYQRIYELTTQREIESSTLCQLLAYKEEYPKGLDGNKKILFLGDLLMCMFTGKVCSEISVASYSQLFNMRKGDWETEIFQSFNIPVSLCPPVVHPGTVLGEVTFDLQKFLGVQKLKVTAPAVHDTASAACAIPAKERENFAFLATGSWFLMSMELEEAADIEKSYSYQLSNTGMAFGKVLLKKNITAMWLVQECKKQWDRMGYSYTYMELAQKAEEAEPFSGVIDTESDAFCHPEHMVKAIQEYMEKTGQHVPDEKDVGQIVRIIYESIAFKTKEALQMLIDTTGKQVDVIYVIGGANRVSQLNQFLSDVTGVSVKTGPTEASAAGNALLQAYGLGEIASEQEMREIARSSFPVEEYRPLQFDIWQEQYKIYQQRTT